MKSIAHFKKVVLMWYRENGRHTLPWRTTHDPYQILVSEIMLQQTQVDRVVPYYERFITKFPTVQALASASLSDVLKKWSGLGYNRRAKLLRECAQEIVKKHGGKIPKDFAALADLPAIGPYTAGALRAFAFDEPEVFIETNIRAALIHHFFPKAKKVSDTKLMPILQSLVNSVSLTNRVGPRVWYSAFMDYGAYIKKTNPNPSRLSTHYVQQSQFVGSLRQARGAILRTLVSGPANERKLREKTPPTFYKKALESLASEHMIEKVGYLWRLAR